MGAGYSMKAAGNEADVYIYEDVGASWFGGVSAKQFAADLKALGKVDVINVHINSYGGEVFEGVAIYRQLVDHPARVISHIDGVAASIASVIAMAGDEIRISEAGFIMIHNASGGVYGQASDMRKLADLLDTITGTIRDVYEARTQQEADAIRDWMDEERWFTASEAVELLFADTMVDNMRVAAHADFSRHAFANMPKALLAASGDAPIVPPAIIAPAQPLLPRATVAVSAPPPAAPTSDFAAIRARVALQAAQVAARKTA